MIEKHHQTTTIEPLTVEDIGQNGDGLVVVDEQRLYVPYTIPGDTVSIVVRPGKKGRYKILSSRILSRGEKFAEPPCPYYTVCGSCQLQHYNDEFYERFKKEKILQPLRFEGFSDPESLLQELRIIPEKSRRRANVNYHVRADDVELGYHKYHSYRLVTLDGCHVLVPEIMAFLVAVRPVLRRLIAVGMEGEIFVAATATGLDVQIDIRDRFSLSEEQRHFCDELARQHDLARLTISMKQKKDLVLTYRQPLVYFDGVPVECDCRSFLQPSAIADEWISEHVLGFLPAEKTEKKGKLRILDLFCGRGTLSLPLSRYGKVQGYDSDTEALQALTKAAIVSQRPIQTTERNLFTQPLPLADLTSYDVAVIDPPRAGAEDQCRALAQSGIPTLIYVSCNPLTFARDARILTQEGDYQLIEIAPIDQFRWTVHVEIVAKFVRTAKK